MPVTGTQSLEAGGTDDAAAAPRWLPWDPASGGVKTLILDAGYENLEIIMSDMEFNGESVEQSLKNSFPPEIWEKAFEYVEENQLNLQSLEKR